MSEETSIREKEILKILKRKAPGTVAIFASTKGYYRCFNDDVDIVTNQILLSSVGIQYKKIGNEDVVYHNLNNAQYARVVRDLLLFLRFRVELYEEGDDNNYVLKAKGILGNLVDFEDVLAECVEMAEMSTIGCVRLRHNHQEPSENKLVFVSANAQDMRIVVAELDDTPNFTLFEQCLVSVQPRECFLLKDDSKMAPNRFKKLEMAIQRVNIEKTIVEEEAIMEEEEECKKKVQKLFHKKCADLHCSPLIWSTLHTLLAKMRFLGNPQYEGAFFVVQYGADGFMYISNAVLQALDIFAIGADIDATTSALPTSTATLYEHLNRCRSQPGKRLIRDWLRRPLFSHRQIEERLDVVEAFQICASVRQSLHGDLLRRVPDIGQITRKLVQKKGTLQDCYRLYQMVMLLGKIENMLRRMEGELDDGGKLWASLKELILEQLQHSKVEFGKFGAMVESTLDLEYFEESGQFRIKPDIDEELASIAAQMDQLEGKARKLLDKLADRLNCEVKLESNTELGFFFRVTLKSESSLRHIPEVRVVDSSKGGGVRFQTKQLDGLNAEFRELFQNYEQSQAELTKLVIDTCAGYAPALQSLTERIGILDILVSFAVMAASSPASYVRPKILDKGSGVLDLRQCRHPMVENLPGMQFIPNDVRMGSNAECRRFMVLTGANMGGKSTYLKAAALTVLLGQIGCFVPCESATFSMVDGIYTRVGAGDFQCKGISTFMAEMVDCAGLLEKATANSLVLVDELGRGTSTYDGFGLAWAIAEDIIRRIDCFTIFATHFHEISKLEEEFPEKVRNYRMDTLIADGQLTILHQVVPGVADRSFGLNIAQMVGIPQAILEEAEKYLQRLERGDLPKEEEEEEEGDAGTMPSKEELLKLTGAELRQAILKNTT